MKMVQTEFNIVKLIYDIYVKTLSSLSSQLSDIFKTLFVIRTKFLDSQINNIQNLHYKQKFILWMR